MSKLTDAIIAASSAKVLQDGAGLVLRRFGKDQWVKRIRQGGKERMATLGTYPAMSIEMARQAAGAAPSAAQPPAKDRALAQLRNTPQLSGTATQVALERIGKDGKEAALKVTAPGGAPTFASVAAEWLRRGRGAAPATVAAHKRAVALMGSLHIVPIDAIDWEQARACLQGIQDQHGVYTAHRTKFLMRKIFTYARENCVRSLVNPVADSDTWLEDKPRAKHHAAIVDPVEFRKLVTEVSLCGLYDADRVCSPNVGNALRLLLHTVVRQGELRGARWGEFKGDLWEIPAARM